MQFHVYITTIIRVSILMHSLVRPPRRQVSRHEHGSQRAVRFASVCHFPRPSALEPPAQNSHILLKIGRGSGALLSPSHHLSMWPHDQRVTIRAEAREVKKRAAWLACGKRQGWALCGNGSRTPVSPFFSLPRQQRGRLRIFTLSTYSRRSMAALVRPQPSRR